MTWDLLGVFALTQSLLTEDLVLELVLAALTHHLLLLVKLCLMFAEQV